MVCALAAVISLWTRARDVRTDDQNRDGRPDVWRVYDHQGQLTAVAVDTNFDGRSDVHEDLQGGALVRRESDRDFNDRVDLVQEFDATTREAVRSVVRRRPRRRGRPARALSRAARPVYSKWADGRSRRPPPPAFQRDGSMRSASPGRSSARRSRGSVPRRPGRHRAPRRRRPGRLCWACGFRWVARAASPRRPSPRVFVRDLTRQDLPPRIRLHRSVFAARPASLSPAQLGRFFVWCSARLQPCRYHGTPEGLRYAESKTTPTEECSQVSISVH